jgi:hypothetical protein
MEDVEEFHRELHLVEASFLTECSEESGSQTVSLRNVPPVLEKCHCAQRVRLL